MGDDLENRKTLVREIQHLIQKYEGFDFASYKDDVDEFWDTNSEREARNTERLAGFERAKTHAKMTPMVDKAIKEGILDRSNSAVVMFGDDAVEATSPHIDAAKSVSQVNPLRRISNRHKEIANSRKKAFKLSELFDMAKELGIDIPAKLNGKDDYKFGFLNKNDSAKMVLFDFNNKAVKEEKKVGSSLGYTKYLFDTIGKEVKSQLDDRAKEITKKSDEYYKEQETERSKSEQSAVQSEDTVRETEAVPTSDYFNTGYNSDNNKCYAEAVFGFDSKAKDVFDVLKI